MAKRNLQIPDSAQPCGKTSWTRKYPMLRMPAINNVIPRAIEERDDGINVLYGTHVLTKQPEKVYYRAGTAVLLDFESLIKNLSYRNGSTIGFVDWDSLPLELQQIPNNYDHFHVKRLINMARNYYFGMMRLSDEKLRWENEWRTIRQRSTTSKGYTDLQDQMTREMGFYNEIRKTSNRYDDPIMDNYLGERNE